MADQTQFKYRPVTTFQRMESLGARAIARMPVVEKRKMAERQRQSEAEAKIKYEEEVKRSEIEAKQLAKKGKFYYQGKLLTVPRGVHDSKKSYGIWLAQVRREFQDKFGREPTSKEFRDLSSASENIYNYAYGAKRARLEAKTLSLAVEKGIMTPEKARAISLGLPEGYVPKFEREAKLEKITEKLAKEKGWKPPEEKYTFYEIPGYEGVGVSEGVAKKFVEGGGFPIGFTEEGEELKIEDFKPKWHEVIKEEEVKAARKPLFEESPWKRTKIEMISDQEIKDQFKEQFGRYPSDEEFKQAKYITQYEHTTRKQYAYSGERPITEMYEITEPEELKELPRPDIEWYGKHIKPLFKEKVSLGPVRLDTTYEEIGERIMEEPEVPRTTKTPIMVLTEPKSILSNIRGFGAEPLKPGEFTSVRLSTPEETYIAKKAIKGVAGGVAGLVQFGAGIAITRWQIQEVSKTKGLGTSLNLQAKRFTFGLGSMTRGMEEQIAMRPIGGTVEIAAQSYTMGKISKYGVKTIGKVSKDKPEFKVYVRRASTKGDLIERSYSELEGYKSMKKLLSPADDVSKPKIIDVKIGKERFIYEQGKAPEKVRNYVENIVKESEIKSEMHSQFRDMLSGRSEIKIPQNIVERQKFLSEMSKYVKRNPELSENFNILKRNVGKIVKEGKTIQKDAFAGDISSRTRLIDQAAFEDVSGLKSFELMDFGKTKAEGFKLIEPGKKPPKAEPSLETVTLPDIGKGGKGFIEYYKISPLEEYAPKTIVEKVKISGKTKTFVYEEGAIPEELLKIKEAKKSPYKFSVEDIKNMENMIDPDTGMLLKEPVNKIRKEQFYKALSDFSKDNPKYAENIKTIKSLLKKKPEGKITTDLLITEDITAGLKSIEEISYEGLGKIKDFELMKFDSSLIEQFKLLEPGKKPPKAPAELETVKLTRPAERGFKTEDYWKIDVSPELLDFGKLKNIEQVLKEKGIIRKKAKMLKPGEKPPKAEAGLEEIELTLPGEKGFKTKKYWKIEVSPEFAKFGEFGKAKAISAKDLKKAGIIDIEKITDIQKGDKILQKGEPFKSDLSKIETPKIIELKDIIKEEKPKGGLEVKTKEGLLLELKEPKTEKIKIKEPEKIDIKLEEATDIYDIFKPGFKQKGKYKPGLKYTTYEYAMYPEQQFAVAELSKDFLKPFAFAIPMMKTKALDFQVSVLGLKVKQKQKIAQKQKYEQLTTFAVPELLFQEPIPETILKQKQKYIVRQRERQKEKPLKRLLLKLPSLEEPLKRKVKEKKKISKSYNLFVKEKRKWQKIGKPMRRGTALDLGAEISDQTPVASFKIEPSKRRPQPEPRAKPGYFRSSKDKIREYKVRKGAKMPLKEEYIEREGFRIDTRGEHEGITVKGWLSRKKGGAGFGSIPSVGVSSPSLSYISKRKSGKIKRSRITLW